LFAGLVAVGSCDHSVYIIDAVSGELERTVDVGGYIAASVALDRNAVFAGTYEGAMSRIALDTGEVLWTYRHSGDGFQAPPTVGGSQVVCGTRDGLVLSLDKESGDKVWQTRMKGPVTAGMPSCLGRILVASEDGRLSILDARDGRILWFEHFGSPLAETPAVAGNRLVVTADDGQLVALVAGIDGVEP
jgi:outer membrane protein assembly factor BamB